MLLTVAPIWKEAPFIRLLVPFIAGIIAQWYIPLPIETVYTALCFLSVLVIVSFFFKGYFLYKYKWIPGCLIMLLATNLGMVITHHNNIQHQQAWFGNHQSDSSIIIASLVESPVEKNKSYKAVAEAYAMDQQNGLKRTKGKMIIYFSKDSSIAENTFYGSTILFKKPLQPIKNSGNPGAFNYQRYCLFQDITHQVYLTKNDFTISENQLQPAWLLWLEKCRVYILRHLKKYIPGKREAGVAEALLIGYRNDLDRDLVQQYSNTGVIHVIAISGMHLAMIYGLLVILLRPLQKSNKTKWIRGAVILLILWGFSLLSGAGASILRSVVMFSFIVIGESMTRQVSVYHTLSASAFFLLCWNPFLLWDIGFQLSYAAVLSIVVFLKPVTNWFYFRNKITDAVWKLCAVTLAAQILTTPLAIYHFHQAPNLFLLSNLVVVPLSGIVLYAEIILCLLPWLPFAAEWVGLAITLLLQWMNSFTAWVNDLPYAVSSDILISPIQVLLLYAFIACTATWLMLKKGRLLLPALACLLVYAGIRAADIYAKSHNTSMIVYNVPRHTAIDFFDGRNGYYVGDDTVNADNSLRNFHLQPARLLNRAIINNKDVYRATDHPFVWVNGKRILLMDTVAFTADQSGPTVDIIVLSRNVRSSITQLWQQFRCSTYVFDGSCPAWKTRQWKNECDSLLLRRHSVAEDGAFVLD